MSRNACWPFLQNLFRKSTLSASSVKLQPIKARADERYRFIGDKPSLHQETIVKGIVYHSLATDVYLNLSFEDWVYNNLDLSSSDILLLWRNDPSVVIGRHQNPWAECNHRTLAGSKVKLARRRSGGGAVYHDHGNLNCTFFTSRKRYKRRRNLDTIISAVRSRWPDVDLEATCRDDIVLNKSFKISGSASKLGRDVAYHHCTLLHSCDKQLLAELLTVDANSIIHKATPSVPSVVKNLSDVNAGIDHRTLVDAITEEFYKIREPLDKPQIYDIDPSDEQVWPGIHSSREELQSWQWVYGKTPPFSIQRSEGSLSALLHISGGAISGLVVTGVSADHSLVRGIQTLSARLKGVHYTKEVIRGVCSAFLGETRLSKDQVTELSKVCSLIEDAVS